MTTIEIICVCYICFDIGFAIGKVFALKQMTKLVKGIIEKLEKEIQQRKRQI